MLTVGGTIPAEDIAELKELGVAEVFTPGASTDEIVEFIDKRRHSARHKPTRLTDQSVASKR